MNGLDHLFREILGNFPNLENDTDTQIPKGTESQTDKKTFPPRHMAVKLLNIKCKENILKFARYKC